MVGIAYNISGEVSRVGLAAAALKAEEPKWLCEFESHLLRQITKFKEDYSVWWRTVFAKHLEPKRAWGSIPQSSSKIRLRNPIGRDCGFRIRPVSVRLRPKVPFLVFDLM